MIPFKRRSSMKQYSPLKPVKRGFKVWAIADAWNGYMDDLYTGATGGREIALGEKVVLKLSDYVTTSCFLYSPIQKTTPPSTDDKKTAHSWQYVVLCVWHFTTGTWGV